MKKLNIIYAEDDIQTRKNHTIYLESNYNCKVYEASDGIEAFKLYLEIKPDILITDITMPNLNGLQLVQKIRKIDNKIQIIILTAHSEEDKLLKAIELNLISYIIKPINRKKLNESFQKAIEQISNNSSSCCHYFNINSYFDHTKEILIVKNKKINLTIKELELLKFLTINKNKVVSSIDIFSKIWDFSNEYSANAVRTLVKKLRDKLPPNSIENSYGGYYKII